MMEIFLFQESLVKIQPLTDQS